MRIWTVCIACVAILGPGSSLPGQVYRFDSELEFTENFDPDLQGPPDGLEYLWTEDCEIQGGGLTIGQNFANGVRTITLTSQTVPILQENDRLFASIDFLFDTGSVTAITNLIRIFIAPQTQVPELFTATANTHANVYMSGSYTEPSEEGFLLLAESAPKNYSGRQKSSALRMPNRPTPYLMKLEMEVIGVGDNQLELTAKLINLESGTSVEIIHTDSITGYNLRDDYWRLGISIGNSNAIRAIDNFRISYIPFSDDPPVTVTEPELENGIMKLNWSVSPGLKIDLYRSRDMLRWEGPILENISSGSFEEQQDPDTNYYFAIVHSGLPFPNNENSVNIANALDTSSWSGVHHGHVAYDQQTGYSFSTLEYGHVYPEQDPTAEGGYRFYDARGAEILMQAPVSLNNGFTSPTAYDFRLTDALLDTTAYELFDPSELSGAVPTLELIPEWQVVDFPDQEWGGVYWNRSHTVPVESVGPSSSISIPNGVWAYNSQGFDASVLLLRQPITIGAAGLLGNPTPVSLTVQFVTDCSVYLRRADDSLLKIGSYFEESMLGAFLDPAELQPGTNYLEIYGSYGLTGWMENFWILEDFENVQVSQFMDWVNGENYNYEVSWPDQWNIVEAAGQFAPTVPASFGNILYFKNDSIETSASDMLMFSNWGFESYPDMQYRCVVGKATADDDEIRLWFRHKASGPSSYNFNNDLRHLTYYDGWYFFLAGSAIGGGAGNGGHHVGLVRTDRDGRRTVVASDLDTPALADWHANHGVVDSEAGHWTVEIETFGDTITIRLSGRGDANTRAGWANALVFEYVDPDYNSEYASYATNLAFEAWSQNCWIDEIDVSQLTAHGGLRIDTGEIAEGGLQSVDAIIRQPRYVVQNGQIIDRFGDLTANTSANPQMTSSADDNWIDYVPGTPLVVGSENELLQGP